MAKNLHNLEGTKKIGLLTNEQKNAIKENKINKDMRWRLAGPKKGRLLIGLKALVEDLSLLLGSEKFNGWSEEFRVKQELQKLEGIIYNHYAQYSLPHFRLAVTTIEKTRKYYLKKMDYVHFPAKDLKIPSFMFELFTKGLKQNEKLFIEEYVKKVGYELPLEEEKKYSWNQLKKLLTEKMEKPVSVPSDKTKDTMLRNMRAAWEMIDQKISPQERNEIIVKTGFGIRLQGYHSP